MRTSTTDISDGSGQTTPELTNIRHNPHIDTPTCHTAAANNTGIYNNWLTSHIIIHNAHTDNPHFRRQRPNNPGIN